MLYRIKNLQFIILSGSGYYYDTTPGIIITSRKVIIAGLKKDTQYWGAAIGATLAGATTYGLTAGDNVLEEAAIVIAVIGGAMAGLHRRNEK